MHDAAGNISASAAGTDIQRQIDAHPPVISSIILPNSSMIVGNTYTATITIGSDAEIIPYTLISGKLSADSLSFFNLQRVNSTSYTVQFTINDNGTDYAGSAAIPFNNLEVHDVAGNTSNILSGNVSPRLTTRSLPIFRILLR